VSVSVTATCRIDELVNFLAALSAQPELAATEEIRFGTPIRTKDHARAPDSLRLVAAAWCPCGRAWRSFDGDGDLSGKLRLLDLGLLLLAGLLYWHCATSGSIRMLAIWRYSGARSCCTSAGPRATGPGSGSQRC